LAKSSLAVGIVATFGANLAHGLNHGPIGALVSAWPALALVGSFELLMLLIRTHQQARSIGFNDTIPKHCTPPPGQIEQAEESVQPSLEDTVRSWHSEGRSQRSIARDLNLNRRKVKQIIDSTLMQATA
jgi:hypothetical protein